MMVAVPHMTRVCYCLMLKLNLSNCRLRLQGSIRFNMTSVRLVFDINIHESVTTVSFFFLHVVAHLLEITQYYIMTL